MNYSSAAAIASELLSIFIVARLRLRAATFGLGCGCRCSYGCHCDYDYGDDDDDFHSWSTSRFCCWSVSCRTPAICGATFASVPCCWVGQGSGGGGSDAHASCAAFIVSRSACCTSPSILYPICRSACSPVLTCSRLISSEGCGSGARQLTQSSCVGVRKRTLAQTHPTVRVVGRGEGILSFGPQD